VKRKSHPVIVEDVLMEDYAAEGKSLARVNGKVIFIENTIPGDVVDVQLHKNKKDWAEGFPVHFKKKSPDRIDPFCKHFGICGGCQWQMLPYEKQLVYKQQQVVDNLQRIGKIELPEILPIIGCENTRFYRNKIEYTFCNKKYLTNTELHDTSISTYQEVAGFHAKGMFDKVVEIDVCHLQQEPTNLIRKAVARFGIENKIPFYDIKKHTGWLLTMQIRTSTTGELMVNIMLGYEDKENTKRLLDSLLKEFPQITTLLYTVNTKFNDSLYGLEPETYFGKGYITEKLEDFKFKISPKSFFQTNTKQSENLYRVAREFAQLNGTQNVYDLYCGTGSIGIFLSKKAKNIIGVEMVEDAVKDAEENARLNKIEHASFFSGDVIDICNESFFEMHGQPDVVITDPPRAGMHEKLVKKLLDISAPLIVYVSCNPATQARDLNLLNEKYSVEKIQPVDMFPHTHHIENVVQLKLKN
jgi:23S rRNA (uracil1939-C5)-methyltransferase